MNHEKILIIDDSHSVRMAVGATLSGAGFDVLEASDGEEGRARIRDTDDLALVICDVNMPRMDGLSMLELVKAEPRFADLPILMLTAEGEPDLVRRARDHGARGWIVKPVQEVLLLHTVRRLIRASGERAAK